MSKRYLFHLMSHLCRKFPANGASKGGKFLISLHQTYVVTGFLISPFPPLTFNGLSLLTDGGNLFGDFLNLVKGIRVSSPHNNLLCEV